MEKVWHDRVGNGSHSQRWSQGPSALSNLTGHQFPVWGSINKQPQKLYNNFLKKYLFLQNLVKRYLLYVHTCSQPNFKAMLKVIFPRMILMVRLLQSRADKSSAASFSAHVKTTFLGISRIPHVIAISEHSMEGLVCHKWPYFLHSHNDKKGL